MTLNKYLSEEKTYIEKLKEYKQSRLIFYLGGMVGLLLAFMGVDLLPKPFNFGLWEKIIYGSLTIFIVQVYEEKILSVLGTEKPKP